MSSSYFLYTCTTLTGKKNLFQSGDGSAKFFGTEEEEQEPFVEAENGPDGINE
jgi:hypothetical protein